MRRAPLQIVAYRQTVSKRVHLFQYRRVRFTMRGHMHVASSARSAPPTVARGAYPILWLLTAINLINYVDRYVLAAVGKQVTDDLNLTQAQFGWFGFALILSYTVLTPLFGWLGDRHSRTKLMTAGVGVWSLATALGGLANSFVQM